MENNNTATIDPDVRTVDPALLDIEANIRSNAADAITPAFQDSITEYGVRSPITVVERDGKLLVRDGQLRTLAAQRAGLTSVPVLVVPETASTADEATIERIREQWVHNEHRVGMSARDRAAAMRQLALAGVSATRIAKLTKTSKKDVVDKALAAAASTRALDAMDEGLTLDQAVILAQYDGDQEATDKLLAAAAQSPNNFQWVAQRLADTAEDRAILRAARIGYEEAGIAVTTSRPSSWDGVGLPIYSVVTDEGKAVENIEDIPIAHRLAYLYAVSGGECWLDAEGKPVDEGEVDWGFSGDEGQVLKDGMIDPRTLVEGEEEPTAAVEWWVRDIDTLDGFCSRQSYQSAHGKPAEDQSAADAEVAKEKERAERRRVRELNKQGDTANTVRRAKLREILSRKTLPKGSAATVAAFLATTMVSHHLLFGVARQTGSATDLTEKMLSGTKPLDAIEGASAERIQIVNLAIVAGAYEADLPKDAWRSHYYARAGKAGAAWLDFLAEVFGYQLSDVEKVITGELKAEAVDLD